LNFVPALPYVDGLVALMGKDLFVSALEELMFNGQIDYNNYLPNPFYWAGNEPDILSVYEFVFAGRADKTQRYLRWLMEFQYKTDPSGLPGNDDYGTMSAWFLWGNLGIYPLSGSTTFMVGSPLFDSIAISFPNTNNTNDNNNDNNDNNRDNDSTSYWTIKTYNAGPNNIYVDKAALNGNPIDMQNRAIVDWNDLKLHTPGNSAMLEFWMKSSN